MQKSDEMMYDIFIDGPPLAEHHSDQALEKLYPSEHKSWRNMVRGCDPGGCWERIGISCYQPWMDSFQTFMDDMGPKPEQDSRLKRKDIEKDYHPDNCFWERLEEFHERIGAHEFVDSPLGRMAIVDLSAECGVAVTTLLRRVREGVTGEDLILLSDSQFRRMQKRLRQQRRSVDIGEELDDSVYDGMFQ